MCRILDRMCSSITSITKNHTPFGEWKEIMWCKCMIVSVFQVGLVYYAVK